MSKVVHLSDDAHNLAKDYCAKLGVKMSDWVADLITRSITGASAPARSAAGASSAKPAPAVSQTPASAQPMSRSAPAAKVPDRVTQSALVPKKKPIVRLEVRPQTDESGVPAYAAPPFWARAQKQ
jgi:hypothetical protein